jgi:hypothetical protein
MCLKESVSAAHQGELSQGSVDLDLLRATARLLNLQGKRHRHSANRKQDPKAMPSTLGLPLQVVHLGRSLRRIAVSMEVSLEVPLGLLPEEALSEEVVVLALLAGAVANLLGNLQI